MLNHASPPKPDMRERRRTDRCTVIIAAEVQLISGAVPLWTSSVSARGVFISSAHVAPVGATLHLMLHLPGGPLESVATVVRVLPGIGMGCRISVPGEQERRRWQSYLESLPLQREIVLEDVLLDDPRDLFDFSWRNEDEKPREP
jgi:hypothetical protein